MADPHHVAALDSFDRFTVRLYRSGLLISTLGVLLLSALTAWSWPPTPALISVLFGTLLSVLNIHLYDKRVRWVIAAAASTGTLLLSSGALTQTSILQWAGLGFLFVALSAFALKEQFCFRIPGLRLVPLFLAGSLAPLVLEWRAPAALLLLVATGPMLVLGITKARMPLHFDIGDKSNYQI